MIYPNPNSRISDHFTWKEALWLPKWDRCAEEKDGLNDQIIENLKSVFYKMDQVRNFFGLPIFVHVAYRPVAYNALVNGAKTSAHLDGLAVDFHVVGLSCRDAIDKMIDADFLKTISMRCENNGPEPTWIHLDSKKVVPGKERYFLAA